MNEEQIRSAAFAKAELRSERLRIVAALGFVTIFIIYKSSEDRFTEMSAHALLLGTLPSFPSDPPTHVQLQSGDLLVLTTDGFFERENDQGEQFGLSRMERVVRVCKNSSSVQIITHLHESFSAFANGTKQHDDLTAVVIKRL
jgi:phosphoserine phosphatase RsbU/P